MKGLEFLDGVDLDKLEGYLDYPEFFKNLRRESSDITIMYSITLSSIRNGLDIPFNEIPLNLNKASMVLSAVFRYRLEVGK